jgi:hypothetical protein
MLVQLVCDRELPVGGGPSTSSSRTRGHTPGRIQPDAITTALLAPRGVSVHAVLTDQWTPI